MAHKSISCLLPLTIALCACGTNIEYIELNSPSKPLVQKPGSAVEVFSTAKPPKPYVEIATLESKQQSSLSLDRGQGIIDKMRDEAGRRGCDGLILLGSNDETIISANRHSISSSTLKGYRATCIVYK